MLRLMHKKLRKLFKRKTFQENRLQKKVVKISRKTFSRTFFS